MQLEGICLCSWTEECYTVVTRCSFVCREVERDIKLQGSVVLPFPLLDIVGQM